MNTYTQIPKLAVNDGKGLRLIRPDEIVYCCSGGGQTHLHLSDGAVFTASKNLKELSEYLKENDFVRIHHSYIINLAYARRFENSRKNYVLMDNGDKLDVSYSRKSELLNRFIRL